MQNFNSLVFTQTDLDQFLAIFLVNIRFFLEKFQKISILKKNLIVHRKRPKFKPSSNFTKNSKVILIFFTPECALEISKFQNSEYEVHQSSPSDEG
jgi:hypothetical protein